MSGLAFGAVDFRSGLRVTVGFQGLELRMVEGFRLRKSTVIAVLTMLKCFGIAAGSSAWH